MSNSITTQEDVQRVELLEEHIHIDKRVVTLGRVFVETKVETKQHMVEALLRQDKVEVERVAIGKVVETAPEIREEDGVLIIPVVEEQLVVQVRLILKEELRVTKTSTEEMVRQAVPVRSEHATVTRTKEPGADHPGFVGDDEK